MFTGLVSAIGTVEGADGGADGTRLAIASGIAAELAEGDSVAVAGCCLTASELGPDRLVADVMNQTLELTTLGALRAGDRVNLEPALRATDRLGGHIVQGHVDATATVVGTEADGFARRVRVALPAELSRYVVEHGSIAIDGVSLTVARLAGTQGAEVEVSLIPETLERTTLGGLEPGARVNVEVDLLARHAERLLQTFMKSDGS